MSATPSPTAEMLPTTTEPEKQALQDRLEGIRAIPNWSTLLFLASALRDDVAPEVTLAAMERDLRAWFGRPSPNEFRSIGNAAALTSSSRPRPCCAFPRRSSR